MVDGGESLIEKRGEGAATAIASVAVEENGLRPIQCGEIRDIKMAVFKRSIEGTGKMAFFELRARSHIHGSEIRVLFEYLQCCYGTQILCESTSFEGFEMSVVPGKFKDVPEEHDENQ